MAPATAGIIASSTTNYNHNNAATTKATTDCDGMMICCIGRKVGSNYSGVEDEDAPLSSKSTLVRQLELPQDHGLLIVFHPDEESGVVTVHAVLDRHYPTIHPNVYAPASLQNVHLLYGGGSGAAVFSGTHPTLGTIVMKHGSAKDTKEVFSLVTISDEIIRRRRRLCHDAAIAATAAMSQRIPSFRMVYISPHHLRDRAQELWYQLRQLAHTLSGRRRLMSLSTTSLNSGDHCSPSPLSSHHPAATAAVDGVRDGATATTDSTFAVGATAGQRSIWVTNGTTTTTDNNVSNWLVHKSSVEIPIPQCDHLNHNDKSNRSTHTTDNNNSSSNTTDVNTPAVGIEFLREFGRELMVQEEKNHWKVTLGQKWIGGSNPVNTADILTSRQLHGALLTKLLDEFTAVMDELDQMTLPEERNGLYEQIQKEVLYLQTNPDIRKVSKMIDVFVGRSVIKNFHPENGRFYAMRTLGKDLRNANLVLTPEEQLPASVLGRLLMRGANMDDIFTSSPSSKSVLDSMEDRGWFDIVQHATQFDTTSCRAMTECIWTCGLTDAGLHNSFLSLDRGLELFDLGEPNLQPRPAFLTKFLMSFFHTLGMASTNHNNSKTYSENNHDSGDAVAAPAAAASWAVRFVVVEDDADDGNRDHVQLSLTSETQDMIPYLCQVFTVTLDHCMEHVFGGGDGSDHRVRSLLLKYVVLQLLSDAAFCLHRWESKGGGTQRFDHARNPTTIVRVVQPNGGLEKWLWRSLWDHYIASYVYTYLLLPLIQTQDQAIASPCSDGSP